MIKNLIFDLDNTIIKDQISDAEYYKEPLKKFGYNENDYLKLYEAIDEYDKTITEENRFYNEENMIKVINRYLNTNYSVEFVDELSNVIGKYWTKNIYLTEDIIEYLFKKYNLYIYTNYFEKAQIKRIENIGYLKYFKKLFAADKFGCKQFKKSFEDVLKYMNASPDECIMIGDSKNIDILAANNVGMKSILFDYDGKRDEKEVYLNNYTVINNMNRLYEIL